MPVDWDCVGGAWGVLVAGTGDADPMGHLEGNPLPEEVLLTNRALWLKYQQMSYLQGAQLKSRYKVI